ncbi:mutator family transposase [Nitritalea halalkaliphila LW7]|uniref:Mutator family transposase n=1 Tax=Nitritalea halalkaliphila LW7 TaxID=1189621 RepID=I5C087_9BACT|nr:mutator family transposase [Nitritalea halalkaliphila LW7]
MDAIHFKVREDGKYSNSAIYTVFAIDMDGNRDVLGLYMSSGGERAKKWGMVMDDLKMRGVVDILVICTDDLKGFSEQIQDSFPYAIIQKCVVHQIRNSLKHVDDKDKKEVTKDLRYVYTSPTVEMAGTALAAFEVKWGKKYGYIVKQWKTNWDELMAFMDFSTEMRRMIYTTNPAEALHRIMRRLIKSKGAWV